MLTLSVFTEQLQTAEQKVKSSLRLDLEKIISEMMLRNPYERTVFNTDNCSTYMTYMSSCDRKNIVLYLKWLKRVSLWPLEYAFTTSTIS